MVKSITEAEIIEDLLISELGFFDTPKGAAIRNVARDSVGFGSVFTMLSDTPGQTYDTIRVLVDDKVVVGFDVNRDDLFVDSSDIINVNVSDYAKAISGGYSVKQLSVAISRAKQKLKR